jgi:hypothetical protein
MKKLISVRQALEDPAWLGTLLGEPSFGVMRTLLIASMGEPLEPEELSTFTRITGRTEAPSEPADELIVIAGRRSGKTRAIGTLATYLAGCVDHRGVLGPGEHGVLPIMAASTLQAVQCYNFVRGIFTDIPRFAALVRNMTGDCISLKNRVDIQIRPASFRTIRGITAIAAIAEECSMWQSDEFGSRNADKEILDAVRPSLATTGGPLFVIGSPHARRGEMWKTFSKHYGPQGNPAILVANGPTKLFNPTIKQSVIDRAYEDDPAVAAAEWGGQFRSDLESYVSPETVAGVTDRGVHQREFRSNIHYTAHCDPSGGRQDSFTVAIGHVENGIGVLDVLLERKPPFSPTDVVSEFCETLKSYGIASIEGDKYGAEFVQEQFRLNGIRYAEAEKTTSEYFAGFLPILNSSRCRLLDSKRLAAQLCSLERRASRVGAKDQIGHPPGGHDDLCASVAGVLVNVAAKTPMIISDAVLRWSQQPAPGVQRQFNSFEGRF